MSQKYLGLEVIKFEILSLSIKKNEIILLSITINLVEIINGKRYLNLDSCSYTTSYEIRNKKKSSNEIYV